MKLLCFLYGNQKLFVFSVHLSLLLLVGFAAYEALFYSITLSSLFIRAIIIIFWTWELELTEVTWPTTWAERLVVIFRFLFLVSLLVSDDWLCKSRLGKVLWTSVNILDQKSVDWVYTYVSLHQSIKNYTRQCQKLELWLHRSENGY